MQNYVHTHPFVSQTIAIIHDLLAGWASLQSRILWLRFKICVQQNTWISGSSPGMQELFLQHHHS